MTVIDLDLSSEPKFDLQAVFFQNRMYDSLAIFKTISYSEYFKNTSTMLFFNKCDLLEEKLKRVPFTICFQDYQGLKNRKKI